jgi:hypothetical protein
MGRDRPGKSDGAAVLMCEGPKVEIGDMCRLVIPFPPSALASLERLDCTETNVYSVTRFKMQFCPDISAESTFELIFSVHESSATFSIVD